jgi:uncharacterized protein (DUF433 family)
VALAIRSAKALSGLLLMGPSYGEGPMDVPDFLTQDPDGEIHLTGHRIGLYTLVRYYKEKGYTAQEIAEEFPSLPLTLVEQALAFYLENQAEVDAYVTAYGAELDRLEAAPPGPGVLRIRQLMAARQKPQKE